METTIYKYINRLWLASVLALLTLMFACEKEDQVPAPIITEVRNYDASPNDTIVNTINTGQWVVIMGRNLGQVAEVYFGNTPATVNNTLFTNARIVVQIPSIPFQTVPNDKLNEITVVSAGGMATYTISIVGEPVISYIRDYAEHPYDTVLNAIGPGQVINIVGYNLKYATSIAFQGIEADLADVVYSDSSIVIQVPEELSGSDASLANTVTYTTALGTGSFEVKIYGPPVILRVSCEVPNEGDLVFIHGENLTPVESLTFAGAIISEISESEDGKSISFIAPALTQSGPVEITSLGGSFTSPYHVNDLTTGMISDFEWGPQFNWEWWGGAELKSNDPDFLGNSGQYLVLKTNVLNSGAGDETSTAIRLGNVQWLPANSLTDPVNSWALKFEISIPNPWNGGTITIKSSNANYSARYEPWQISAARTADYSTTGWQTVTIPLSSFRKSDATLGEGKGARVGSTTELVGPSGQSNMVLYMHNFGSSPTKTGFHAAFDNFRVVRN